MNLLAENERLRAWNARLRAQIAEYYAEPGTHEVERLRAERDEAQSKETDYREGLEEGWDAAQEAAAAENERLLMDNNALRAKVERLRETVQWYGDRACALSGADNKYPFSDLFEDAGARARNALEAKP